MKQNKFVSVISPDNLKRGDRSVLLIIAATESLENISKVKSKENVFFMINLNYPDI